MRREGGLSAGPGRMSGGAAQQPEESGAPMAGVDPRRDSHPERIPWLASAGILGTVSGAMMAIVGKWAEIEPVLESPATIVIALMAFYLFGGFSAYWVMVRPMEAQQRRTEDRLQKAEGVIKDLRRQEREQLLMIGRLERDLAVLGKEVEMLRIGYQKPE